MISGVERKLNLLVKPEDFNQIRVFVQLLECFVSLCFESTVVERCVSQSQVFNLELSSCVRCGTTIMIIRNMLPCS